MIHEGMRTEVSGVVVSSIMRIYLDSNFFLLGAKDMESIDLECAEISARGLLESLSRHHLHSLKFLQPRGKALRPGWDIEINGRKLALYDEGLNSVLKEGDRVAIRLELLSGG